MRRAIAAAVMGGLVLGGVSATPAFAAAHGASRATDKERSTASAKERPGSSAKPKKPDKAKKGPAATKKPETRARTKTVVYGGYEFQVPASWPVYQLDKDPRTCVRYDVHAVYLGTPGPDMQCPAGLIGRTQTLSFIPGTPAAAGSGSGSASQPEQPGGTAIQRLPAVDGTVTQYATEDELQVSLGPAPLGATVTGTYGTDPAVIQKVLDTLRPAPASTAPASTAPASTAPAGTASAARSASAPRRLVVRPDPATAKSTRKAKSSARATSNPTSTSWRGVPAQWPIEIIQPSPPPPRPSPPSPQPVPIPAPPPQPASVPVGGFDTCTAPSLATMRVWRSDYAAAGVYIGGANAACAPGNLSASWIRSAAAMGWGMLPTYVGPQAPCWGGNGVLIAAAKAAAEGKAAGAGAVSDARSFGLGAGSPVYYDMEAYRGSASCTNAVLTFLSAWDQQVTAAGYVTGVYSSQDSGISDLQTACAAKTPGFTAPAAVWIALWDGVASLSDGSLNWPLADRSKQYAGAVNQTVGGITLNIDKDIVGSPLAR
jgi:hypothetical protein